MFRIVLTVSFLAFTQLALCDENVREKDSIDQAIEASKEAYEASKKAAAAAYEASKDVVKDA